MDLMMAKYYLEIAVATTLNDNYSEELEHSSLTMVTLAFYNRSPRIGSHRYLREAMQKNSRNKQTITTEQVCKWLLGIVIMELEDTSAFLSYHDHLGRNTFETVLPNEARLIWIL